MLEKSGINEEIIWEKSGGGGGGYSKKKEDCLDNGQYFWGKKSREKESETKVEPALWSFVFVRMGGQETVKVVSSWRANSAAEVVCFRVFIPARKCWHRFECPTFLAVCDSIQATYPFQFCTQMCECVMHMPVLRWGRIGEMRQGWDINVNDSKGVGSSFTSSFGAGRVCCCWTVHKIYLLWLAAALFSWR